MTKPHTQPNELFRIATEDDVSALRELLQQGANLKTRQDDNAWGIDPYTEEEVRAIMQRGAVYLYEVDGVPAGTAQVQESDERMWGKLGLDKQALYIHKLCVGDSFRGMEMGTMIMREIKRLALGSNKACLRLDCEYSNQKLCKIYEDQGFVEVDRTTLHEPSEGGDGIEDTYRAALYQKDLLIST